MKTSRCSRPSVGQRDELPLYHAHVNADPLLSCQAALSEKARSVQVSTAMHSHAFAVPGAGSPNSAFVHAMVPLTLCLTIQLDDAPYRTEPSHPHSPLSDAHGIHSSLHWQCLKTPKSGSPNTVLEHRIEPCTSYVTGDHDVIAPYRTDPLHSHAVCSTEQGTQPPSKGLTPSAAHASTHSSAAASGAGRHLHAKPGAGGKAIILSWWWG